MERGQWRCSLQVAVLLVAVLQVAAVVQQQDQKATANFDSLDAGVAMRMDFDNDESEPAKEPGDIAESEDDARCFARLSAAKQSLRSLSARKKAAFSKLHSAVNAARVQVETKEEKAAVAQQAAKAALSAAARISGVAGKAADASQLMAKKLKIEAKQTKKAAKKSAARKQERQAIDKKIAANAMANKVKNAVLKKKMSKLENEGINKSAKIKDKKSKLGEEQERHATLLKSTRRIAIGLNMKEIEIKSLKKALKKKDLDYAKLGVKHKNQISKNKKAGDKLTACQRDSRATRLTKSAASTKAVDKVKLKLQRIKTQSELAKRALQVCEKQHQGSAARKEKRSARRETRLIRKAKAKMAKKSAAKMKASLMKPKIKATLKAKAEKKEAKMIAKEFKKKMKKSLSSKCKACVKLTKAEHTILGADCKTC